MNETPQQPDEILTVRELAAKLKITTQTIYNRISRGDLTREDGVIHLGKQTTRIVWPVLRQRMLDGKVVFRGEE